LASLQAVLGSPPGVALRAGVAALLAFAITWAYEAPYHPCDGNGSGLWLGLAILLLPTMFAVLFAAPDVRVRTSSTIGLACVVAIALAVGIEQSGDEPFGRPGGSSCEFYPAFSGLFVFVVSIFLLTVILSFLYIAGVGREKSAAS
jgi:hypothetical protein